jgi:hypothetical protein
MQICSSQDQRQCGSLHLSFSSVGAMVSIECQKLIIRFPGPGKTDVLHHVAPKLLSKIFIYCNLRVDPLEAMVAERSMIYCAWRLFSDGFGLLFPMKPRTQKLLLSLLILLPAMPVSGQVEKVAMRTTGISCGYCAGLSELSFRRVPGVDKVEISLSKEAIMLSYKPGAVFDPAGIRKILEGWKVGVTQFQISARGHVEEQDGKKFFRANKDKFALTATASSPVIPSNTPVLIEGILNDKSNPMEVKVLNFRPL